MISVVYYLADTGEITLSGSVQTMELATYLANSRNESVLQVNDALATPNTHYVSHQELWLKPLQPSLAHVFNYSTKQWELSTELAWQQVRNQRDNLLVKSDWTQLPDVPLVTKEAWSIYRQALRDVTLQTDPSNIIWPIKPS